MTSRHLTYTKDLLAMVKKQLVSMRKQLMMIFKQTLRKIIVTKKQLLISTIIIPFYKLILIINYFKRHTLEHQNSKDKDNNQQKILPSQKIHYAPPNEKETTNITKKRNNSTADCKRI